MNTRFLISLLLLMVILTWAYVSSDVEARSFSSFRWEIDETYHRDGHVQLVVQKDSENSLPVGIKGLDNVTVTLHPTINHDQTGKAKLPRGVDIYFEPNIVTLTDGKVTPVKLVINVDENAPSSLYDVQVVGTWKEEGKIPEFMGSSIRLHVGHDFGDGKIPINMLEPPLKFWKLIQNDKGSTVNDIPCRNDYVLVVKHDGSPACVTLETKTKLIERDWIKNNDESTNVNWKKYITVSAIRQDHLDLADMLPVHEIDKTDDEIIHRLVVGADGCKNKTELCKISSGVSISRSYPFLPSGISISDNDKFAMSIDKMQAKNLLSSMDWKLGGDSHYSAIYQDKKHYLLILSTFDNVKTPIVKMEIVDTLSDPVSLERGMTLNYPIHINTWATYGAPAQIDLLAVHDAKDSGIKAWIEPETMMIPERNNATSTLFIHASDDTQDGIYDIRVIGKANGNNAELYCRSTVCPSVSIGDSYWSIRTFGSNSGMGIGSGMAPEDTFLELDLNKKEFFEGEIVEIKAYLINNGTRPIVLDGSMNLLIKAIRADSSGYYDHFYGIDARNESDSSITLEPNSKVLLVRPFYWNQMTFENIDDEHRLEPSSRKMIATFVAGEHAWKDDMWFEIK